ncbi:uncharacterized protein DDB_G0274171 isoform X2 [Parasteatoda tepidariorum]|uniref:uncharacterized protein DDB_G0274171 isoform X2 n=1 Tax=Parasteatoda tepidariorum TaxID=114398 RepID=UPI0039BC5CDD
MYKVSIISLFFICAATVSSACKVDCRTVRCAAPICDPGYESFKPPCECCNKCRKIKGPPCKADCSTVDCAYVECDPGYESYTPPCECCNKCRKIKNPPCNVDCRTVLCAAVECAPGYESYTPPCECCNKCKKIKNPPCEVDCTEPCPLIKCARGYTSVKPPCKCCNECKKIETPPGSEVCETIDCNGNECPIVDCIEGYKPVRSECGCCDKCVPIKKECNVNCSKKHCPQIRCRTGYKLVKPKCACCEECQKIKDTCGKDEVYNDCGSACPKTCANLGKDQVCTKQCVEGCFCQEGLVRNDSGKCVHPNQCPKNTCGKNEVYSECGSTCPKTCANLGKNQVCSFLCVKGCFCREGMVRNDKGECIQPSQCPKSSCKNTQEDSTSDSESDEGD